MSPALPSTPGRWARCSLLPLWLAFAAPLFAGSDTVYKWTDREGITHFSDLPPYQGARQIDVKPASQPPPPPPAAAKKDATAEGGAEPPSAEQQANPERAEYCRRAREDLKRYQSAERLMRQDDQGRTVLLNDEERKALLERVRADEKKWCE